MSTWDKFQSYLRENNITYQEYLESDHWKDVRSRFYKSGLCKNRCESCGATKNLNLHHKTYKRIGHEWLTDLVLLCQTCHKEVHELERKNTNTHRHLWSITKRVIRGGSVFQATKKKRKSKKRRQINHR